MRSKLYAVAGACLTVAAFTLPGLANASPAAAATGPTASAPSPALAPALATSQPQGGCPRPKTLSEEQCQSIPLPHGTTPAAVKAEKAAALRAAASTDNLSAPLTASDLQSAYGVTSTALSNGTGQTVAVVDAYADPTIVNDLSTYRSDNGLPACDSSTGAGCLNVYNQNGVTFNPAAATSKTSPPLPPDTKSDNEVNWENESALDVEMISAICPNCQIDLFEANSYLYSDLGTAENSAAYAANFISNSWGGFDNPGESALDNRYFHHPGKAVVFAAGDYGYGPAWPASSQFVTSVGGTYLSEPSAGTWSQEAWANQPEDYYDSTGTVRSAPLGLATQSGCSSGEPEPSWGPDSADTVSSSLCANRTQNDVSAVAASPWGTGIISSANDTLGYNTCGGSCSMYGTSVATPIITAMYALAGTPTANTYPASYLYQSASGLTHVTSGNDSLLPYTCERTRGYLCNAAASLTSPYNGYNGPAGLGTPNGDLNPFKNTATGNVVSVTNPGTQDLQAGRSFSLQVDAIDSASGQALSYSASGLPGGLSLSSSGLISGSVAAAGTSTVKVTVTDPTGASTSVSFRITAVGSMTASYHAGAGAVKLSSNGKCLDDSGDSSANGAKVQIWQCYSGDKGQTWTYQPDTYPGDPANAGTYAGTVRINGKCLDIVNSGTANGTKVQLWGCGSQSANQQWEITGSYGELYNPVSHKCLDDPGWSNSNGTQLDIWTCSGGANQNWALPASPIDSAISDRCLNDSGDSSANGTHILSYGCDGSAPEKWTVAPDGTIRINGKCLEEPANSVVNGTYAQLWGCNGNPNQQWYIGAYGQIESVNAQKCLAIPGNSTANGAQVALEDCYGEPGELWAVS